VPTNVIIAAIGLGLLAVVAIAINAGIEAAQLRMLGI